MRPTIYVDLDGMAANLLKRLLEFHNEWHQTRFTETDDWSGLDLDKYLSRDHVFRDLEPVEGFPEALLELQRMGHVVIASAPSRNPDSATDKIRWVLENFPTIPRKDIILIKHKHLLRGDVFLEDWKDNIRAIRKTNEMAFIAAIAYPYNEGEADLDVRAEGVRDTRAAWRTIVDEVRECLKVRDLL